MKQRKFNCRSSQQGYLIMTAVILIVIVAFVGAAIANMFFAASFSTAAHYQSDAALYLAESGLEHATHKLLEPTVANRLSCDSYHSTPLTNTFGAGSYSVTSTASPSPYYVSYFAGISFAPTTLSSAITSASTSIPVASTTNYAPQGRVMIDRELINYEGTTSTSFTNITRGVDGTIAAAHVSGVVVSQYECLLVSTAGVPNLTSPKAQRKVSAAVQLQDAWVVGDANSAGYFTYANYNYPTSPNTWFLPSQSGGVALYGVNYISNADMWWVGNNYIEHWTRYAGASYTPPVNVNYRSVYCTASNACHSVGDVSTKQVIIDWNGSSWTRTAATGQNQANNLRSVHCDSGSDCWAVGDSSGAGVFYHWTGAVPWTGVAQTLSAYPYNSVFCNASNDCWAVGANASFARLTSGTTWANYATGLPAVQYNSVFCNSTSDCWAVGNVSGSNNIFVHWNGSTWSQSSSNPTPLTNLNGVACIGTNDCWAIGSSNTGNNGQFFHWDGTSWTNNTTIAASQTLSPATLRAISVVPTPTTQPITAWSESWA